MACIVLLFFPVLAHLPSLRPTHDLPYHLQKLSSSPRCTIAPYHRSDAPFYVRLYVQFVTCSERVILYNVQLVLISVEFNQIEHALTERQVYVMPALSQQLLRRLPHSLSASAETVYWDLACGL